ncbi:hypothetical protein HZ326_10882 [Fusarium oxysporum f. sp. albedinis]|nr:hypothetical protein HZ326_10882 [Fusarium oxysporum f. sp. albedinis]
MQVIALSRPRPISVEPRLHTYLLSYPISAQYNHQTNHQTTCKTYFPTFSEPDPSKAASYRSSTKPFSWGITPSSRPRRHTAVGKGAVG